MQGARRKQKAVSDHGTSDNDNAENKKPTLMQRAIDEYMNHGGELPRWCSYICVSSVAVC